MEAERSSIVELAFRGGGHVKDFDGQKQWTSCSNTSMVNCREAYLGSEVPCWLPINTEITEQKRQDELMPFR